tara:strand:+ start:235 stop:1086 length:852 start_codon:yes stop_codon:yes gene_type:complete
MQLALGTAQFGMDYGITNQTGQVSQKEIEEILMLCKDSGIVDLDTAISYGSSEANLGEVLQGDDHFRITTKIPSDTTENVTRLIEESLSRLNVDKLDAILFHSADGLLGDRAKERYQMLRDLKDQGYTNHIGVSVYKPCELTRIEHEFEIEAMQYPANLLDQRFVGFDHKPNQRVFVRSIFLQGVLLNLDEKIYCQFPDHRGILQQVLSFRDKFSLSPMASCLAIRFLLPESTSLVVGCCTKLELDEIVSTYQSLSELPEVAAAIPDLATTDERLIMPIHWSA